jgi:DMSO/TMAO reductase YedYZ molybdopterin-dependent catalytic subunit
MRVPVEKDFTRPAHDPRVSSRVGLWLGIAFAVCFATGLLSHGIQHPPGWFDWPTRPVSLYRINQGVHVLSGVAAIPLLLAKLWSVYPLLYARPVVRSPLHAVERGSVLVLIGAAFFQLATGLFNVAQSYPWKFFFPAAHYAVAWIAIGSIVVHVGVKLPTIRDGLTRGLSDPADRPGDGPAGGRSAPAAKRGQRAPGMTASSRDSGNPGIRDSCDGVTSAGRAGNTGTTALGRRGFLGAAALASGAAVLATAGGTVPWLRRVSVLAWTSGTGPQGLPVNRTAEAAGVRAEPGWLLELAWPGGGRLLSLEELTAMPQHTAELPIACVEGWSATATWTGIPVPALLAAVGAPRGHPVRVESMERDGLYRASTLPPGHAGDELTLLAMRVNGEQLHLDHGFPCRIIAPSRPGVLQTKWVRRLEVLP